MIQLALPGVQRLLVTAMLLGLVLLRDGCEGEEAAEQADRPAPVVIIDPGHGGHDPGTLGGDTPTAPEKDITLAIGTVVVARLEAQGVRVIATRTTDEFLELDERGALADRHRASLFVSIHADAADSPSASGATFYIRPAGDAPSRRAAAAIAAKFRSAAIKSRGTARAEFRVLVSHSRPAVLVECGYLTNADDARKLNDREYQQAVARAIAGGILDFLSE